MFIVIDKAVILKSDIRCVTRNIKSITLCFLDGTFENISYSSEEECKQDFENLKSEIVREMNFKIEIVD